MGLWSMSISFSIASYPVSFFIFSRFVRIAVDFCAKSFFAKFHPLMLIFPEPDNSSHSNKLSKREINADIFQVVHAAPVKRMDCPFPARRSAGVGISRFPERYCPVSEWFISRNFLWGPLLQRSRRQHVQLPTHINQIIGRTHGVFIMFDHNQCIAKIFSSYAMNPISGHCL